MYILGIKSLVHEAMSKVLREELSILETRQTILVNRRQTLLAWFNASSSQEEDDEITQRLNAVNKLLDPIEQKIDEIVLALLS